MNYIGSKKRLRPYIKEVVEDFTGGTLEGKVVCDIFAGTGVVGEMFKEGGSKVISNDLQYYSYILNSAIQEETTSEDYKGLLEGRFKDKGEIVRYLDKIEGREGFIASNYCKGGKDNREYERMYFTRENGLKCDAIRLQISEWLEGGKISKKAERELIGGLLYSVDQVANTTSIYGSYLKQVKKRASKEFEYRLYREEKRGQEGVVYNKDANELIKGISGDILYMDPPYNSRQYSTNYHILETIALNDNPEIQGKTGQRVERENSLYCRKRDAREQFEEIIREAEFEYIFVSYNDEGIISREEIAEIMGRYGEYKEYKKEYTRYKADNGREYGREKTYESIHSLKKKI